MIAYFTIRVLNQNFYLGSISLELNMDPDIGHLQ